MFSNKKADFLKVIVSVMLIAVLLCGCTVDNNSKPTGKILPYSVDSAELDSNRYTNIEPIAENAKSLNLDNYKLVLENNNFALYYNKSLASLRLLDKSNNYVWGSLESEKPDNLNKKWTRFANSIVAVEVADKDGSISLASATKQDLTYEKSKSALNFKVSFLDYNLSFNFELILTSDGIRFQIDEKSVNEGKSFKLVSITFIPYFGSVEGNKKAGYMFVPDGCGALIRYNDSRNYLEGFKKRIYGYDYGIDSLATISDAGADRINTFATDEQQVYIPVFGMTHGVRQNAFYAIVEDGDEYAVINADPAGIITNYNRVNASFIYRSNYEQPVNKKSAGVKTVQKESNKLSPVISYHFLSGNDADYVGMAKGYRDYLLLKNEITKISKNNKKTPLRLDILVSDVQKEFIGSSVKKITEYEQIENLLNSLHKSNIRGINLSLFGWQKSGLNGYNILKNENDFVYSKEEISLLKDILNKADGNLLLQTSIFKGSKLQLDTKTKASITMSQNIAEIKAGEDDFYLADKYLAKPKLSIETFKEKQNNDNNLLFDDIGSVLYGEYLENNVTTRGETKKLICDAFNKTNKNDYYFVSPNSYLFGYAKAFYNSPIVSSQYVFETDSVPFLQIALSGYIEMYSPYVNCNLYSKADLLKLIDYDIYPSFVLSGKDNYELRNTASASFQSTNINDWKEYISDSYKIIDDVLKNTFGEPIQNRTVISTGFVKIDYQNGSIYVNYNNNDVNSGDVSLKAESAIFISGGDKNAK